MFNAAEIMTLNVQITEYKAGYSKDYLATKCRNAMCISDLLYGTIAIQGKVEGGREVPYWKEKR